MKTAAQVREMLRASAPEITFRRDESGEYRVTFTQAAIAAAFPGLSRAELIAKAESLAAYESDADSVLETGLAMARTGLRDFGAELAARREMEAAALGDAAERESAKGEIAGLPEGFAVVRDRDGDPVLIPPPGITIFSEPGEGWLVTADFMRRRDWDNDSDVIAACCEYLQSIEAAADEF